MGESGMITVPSFKSEQFPSWAGQGLEYMDEGTVTTLTGEENASDSYFARATFSGVLDNYAGDDFEALDENIDIIFQGPPYSGNPFNSGDTLLTSIACVDTGPPPATGGFAPGGDPGGNG
jgi:hypothetical protein